MDKITSGKYNRTDKILVLKSFITVTHLAFFCLTSFESLLLFQEFDNFLGKSILFCLYFCPYKSHLVKSNLILQVQ